MRQMAAEPESARNEAAAREAEEEEEEELETMAVWLDEVDLQEAAGREEPVQAAAEAAAAQALTPPDGGSYPAVTVVGVNQTCHCDSM